jgi:hypothetical protein
LETTKAAGSILRQRKLPVVGLRLLAVTFAVDLPSKKYLNLAAIKTMVAAAEADSARSFRACARFWIGSCSASEVPVCGGGLSWIGERTSASACPRRMTTVDHP